MPHCSFLLALCLLPSALALRAQSPGASKLSAHFINNYTTGSSNIVAGRPRVLKLLGLDWGLPSGMLQAMRDYKTKCPAGKVVVRIYTAKQYSLSNDPTASALDFWSTVLQPALNSLSASDRALIDYLEGPNEGDSTPTLGYPSSAPLQASQWFNQFWTNLTPQIVAAGLKPCIGSIAVGNPAGTTAEMQSYLAAFVPALRQAKAAGGAWSYHAYTINYTTDVSNEIWYSLRYRQFYSYFASAFPDLNTMPIILTEGGVDQSGSPSGSGWQARGTAANYERWLNWFDQQMQQDAVVLGCTLFENGDASGWPSFELEPIGSWMCTYLTGPSSLPAPPTSLSAVAANGSVTLSWTDLPLTPTAWNVKRSTNNGGPYFTIGQNIATGIQATTFTDTAVNNGTTYYYVVTAVNALGEGDPSAQVAATPPAPAYFAMNCGGTALGPYQADGFFNTGTAYATGNIIDTNGLINPAPMAVYQSQRYQSLTYTFPFLAPYTCYKLRLHFAEVYWTSPGQRVFNVFLNGAKVLNSFDIIQAAGAAYRGNIQEFNAVGDQGGTLTVRLQTLVDNASINGIEIIANPVAGIPAAPSSLAATVGPGLVTLTWTVPPGAGSFTVKRSNISGSGYSVVASNLTAAYYRDASCVPNTTYYYVVSASNAQGESPNSAEVSALTPSGLPDLVITSLGWNPANLYAGSHAVFSARVFNRGSAATPAGTKIGIAYLLDGAEVSWTGNYTTSLAPNAAVTLSADGGPSGVNYWTASTGPHTLSAVVDDLNLISESIEDNNTTTVPVNVLAGGYAFNSGGGAVGSFAADASFAGSVNTFSVTNAIDLSGTPNPAPAAVYQTERWGEFAYVFGNLTPGSNYLVRLHLAEISPSVNVAGDRQFNLSVGGIQVFTNFDIVANAGAKFRAITRDIQKRADASGTLIVQFTRGATNQPKCSGIQVFGTAPPAQPPVITGSSLFGTSAVISWQSSPAVIYQLQSKNDLADPNWTTLNTLVATGTSSSLTNDAAGSLRRFYRVVQVN